METETRVIRISVRNLVEFVMRSGDLDNRRLTGAEKDAMQAGSRIHRKIQKQMGAGYQAEVALNTRIDEGRFQILVEGRADGIMTDVTGHVTIDETKVFIWILTVLRNRSQSIRHRLCAMVICMPEKNSWRKLVSR